MLYRFILIIFLSFNGIISVLGQQKFNFTISFTGSAFNSNDLNINFYEGYTARSIYLNSSNKIVENQIANSVFPVLEFIYHPSGFKPTIYRYFVINHKSSIKINHLLKNDSLIIQQSSGMLNFKDAGQNRFEKFAKNELNNLASLEKKNNYDFSNADSITMNKLTNCTSRVTKKGISFIKTNPKSLYSLWFFMNEILGKPDYSNENVRSIYVKYLQPSFKNSFENKYILDKLSKNRLALNSTIPNDEVAFTDLHGNEHRIKDFRGKPVLIMIWATTCIPCLQEMPVIKQLYLKNKNKLDLISFSTDEDEQKHKDFVTNNNMNWINVFGRYDFCKIYGSDRGIPQVYLIDKNGVIIYSRFIFKDYSLDKLSAIVENITAKD